MKSFLLITFTFILIAHAPAASMGEEKTPERPPPPPSHPLITYTIPKGAATGTRIDGAGGTRGSNVKLPSLYVLAPNHTGLTTRAQPSLFWYQSGPSAAPFQMTLIEPKKPKPMLKVVTDKADQPGIRRIQLARHNITLAPGVCYKWTVALSPDPANHSQDVIASGTIQRIEPDAKLTAALAAAKGEEKAAIYAHNGLWYDALEAITNKIDDAPKSRELHLQRATLLEQAGLKDAAASDRK